MVPVRVKHIGLGGSISVSYACNGCGLKNVVFESSARYECNQMDEINMCGQVAFILAGCTHATYARTLQHALGITAVAPVTFLKTIERMYHTVKEMLDEMCEIARQEMKEKGDELGSWKRAVTS